MTKADLVKLNPNKVLDWTVAALTCKDHQMNSRSPGEKGRSITACQSCPIICPSGSRFGNYETLSVETCKMFDNVVAPLLLAGVPVKAKDKEVYDHYVKTGTSDI